MASNSKFGAKEVLDVVLYDMKTGKPVIAFDTLKTSDIEFTTEKVYARGGRGNPKLITWEINKEGTLTLEDALLSPKSLELISGRARKTGAATIYLRQIHEHDEEGVDKGALFPLTADESGVINLAFTPLEDVADLTVYLAEDDGGEALDMADATLSEKTLTIAAAAGKNVVVYYTYTSHAEAETYIIDATTFSGTYKLVGTTIVRNASTGVDEPFQIVIPNLKWSSALTLNFAAEGDPSVISVECEIMRDAKTGTMITMTKF